MSVIAFTGLPGHGKSYGVVENVILPALRDGRKIVTNIPLDLGAISSEYPNAEILPIELTDFHKTGKQFCKDIPKGAIVVLDEILNMWPAGIKAFQADEDHKKFVSMHRHFVGDDGFTTEIVLVCQDLSQISNFVRLLVEKTYIVTKLVAAGSTKKYRVDIYYGAVCGNDATRHGAISQIFGSYKPEVYKFYSSHTQSTGGVVGNEKIADNRGSIWRKPIVIFGLPAGVLAIVWAIYSIFSIFQGFNDPIDQGEVISAANDTPATLIDRPRPVVGAAPRVSVQEFRPIKVDIHQLKTEIPLSEHFQIVGSVIDDATGEGVVLLDSGSRFIRLDTSDCARLVSAHLEFECVFEGARVTSFSGSGRRTRYSVGESSVKAALGVGG